MTRQAKLAIAALATTLAATLGTAGIAASAEAGKPINSTIFKKDHNWCC
jgi:hypothetical protein